MRLGKQEGMHQDQMRVNIFLPIIQEPASDQHDSIREKNHEKQGQLHHLLEWTDRLCRVGSKSEVFEGTIHVWVWNHPHVTIIPHGVGKGCRETSGT